MTESVLAELVGEGKKFATPEDLAKGKKESDAFIATLTRETKELRELVTTLGTQTEQQKAQIDLLSKLNGKPANDNGSGTSNGKTTEPPVKTLTEEDVSNLMVRREQARQAAANVAAVDAVLLEKFGAEAKKFVSDAAKELGISVEEAMA